MTCGETFTGNAVLAGDCNGTITTETKGVLDLQGFTISGTGLAAIDCHGLCKIIGPGTIASAGSTVGILGDARVRVEGVTVTGHTNVGIQAGEVGGLVVTDSTVSGNGTGVIGGKVKLIDATIENNVGTGVIVTSRLARLKRSIVRGNGGDGINTDVSADGSNRVTAVDSAISDNGEFGILAKNINIKRTSVDANRTSPDCGDTIPCADLGSVKFPRLGADAFCETSMMIPEQFIPPLPFGDTWGRCVDDFAP